MFIQAQSTNSKRCISCKRILNYEFFGHSRTSKDSFNPCCRNCRNQTRRLKYGSLNEEQYFNLKKNNDSKIPVALRENMSFLLNAISTHDLNRYFLNIKIDDSFVCYEIKDDSQNWIFHAKFFIQLNRADFFKKIRSYIVNDLTARPLRLFDTENEIAFLTEY